ncbi:DNA-binding transcriptional LysR family regulator [Sinobaca qinghaiensis]|uniref:DNA-binding transcriptional LysR family regulator n=1 Tax=Sinobaca qinghaiensis TaxID=342944 RepID=A0A419V6R4_9BACL|nr:LysR family transcriptional regulator [Sinobaca qinghaiensis]RKD75541.1 DNA-binding transcriptional LysR family regulator [Sinobaca qinghaiensis]
MESRALEYFREVAVCRSFTKAAASLRIAQPAVSRAVRQLEEELGVRLLIRDKRQIRLTKAGEKLYGHAIDMHRLLTKAKSDVLNMQDLTQGEVEIGLPSMAGSYYFPDQITRFLKAYPGLSVSIYEAGTSAIEEAIINGEIELGTIVTDEGRKSSSQLTIHPFLATQMVAVVPLDHPFASRTSVSHEEVAEEPLILFKEGYYQRKVVDQISEKAGRPVHLAFETNQLSMAKSLTERGLGITIFLEMVIQDDEKLAGVPLDPPVWLTLALAHRQKESLSPANKAFLQFLLA